MKDTRSFIADEYRPTGIRFQDPRNMALTDIRQALQHCYRRQTESGPGSAFRFSLFIGSQRQPTFAIYPDPSNPGPSKSKNPRKKKDKGKQREDALKGLLRIEESVEPPAVEPAEPGTQPKTNPTVGGPANQLQVLQSRSQTTPTPNEAQLTTEHEPAPNPALGGQASHTTSMIPDEVDMPPEVNIARPTTPPNDRQGNDPSHTSSMLPDDCLTTPPNADADLAQNKNYNKTPQQKLGKRVEANLSPRTNRQQQGNSKKKKLTADDRAAMEAQNLVQSGSRQRKPTRRV